MDKNSKTSFINNYLGITDNLDYNYKKEVKTEFVKFLKKYNTRLSEIEMALKEDIGVYLDSMLIIEEGKFVSVYVAK